MLGLYEIIALALSLGNFGVTANPKAPSADAVLEYAVEDADVVAYVDAVPLIAGNYQALTKLPDAPQVKASPQLRDAVGKAIAEVEGARGLVKTTIGLDLTTDLSNATMFARMGARPEMLLVVRGKFPADMVAKVAKMTQGRVETIQGAQAVAVGGAFEMLAVTKSGVALIGTRAFVTARLAPSWKPPSRAKGSALALTAKLLGDKPFYLVAATPGSARFQKMVESSGGADAAVFFKRFQFVAGAVFHNGLTWTIHDKDAAGHARSVMASEGWLELMRAAHLAPRGFAKIMMSFLDDVRSSDPNVAVLKKHKAELLKIVDQFTGDGNFKVKWEKDAKGRVVTVRATGKRLSEVLPFGFLAPAFAWGMLSARSVSSPPPQVVAPPVRPTPKPRTGGGITAPPAPKRPAPAPAPLPRK